MFKTAWIWHVKCSYKWNEHTDRQIYWHIQYKSIIYSHLCIKTLKLKTKAELEIIINSACDKCMRSLLNWMFKMCLTYTCKCVMLFFFEMADVIRTADSHSLLFMVDKMLCMFCTKINRISFKSALNSSKYV